MHEPFDFFAVSFLSSKSDFSLLLLFGFLTAIEKFITLLPFCNSTYSGSLVSVGPLIDGARSVEYTSIDLRGDVPKSASSDDGVLGADINIDNSVEFSKGPIKSSSPVFKIAVFKEEMEAEEEQEQINKATVILTDDFAKINKTIILE